METPGAKGSDSERRFAISPVARGFSRGGIEEYDRRTFSEVNEYFERACAASHAENLVVGIEESDSSWRENWAHSKQATNFEMRN